MRISYEEGASQTIVFAAEELADYLSRMVGDSLAEDWVIHLESDHTAFLRSKNFPRGENFSQRENDSYRIEIGEAGGKIVGNHDRSVLLAVYDYLHYLGCRFPMPSKSCEIVPLIEKETLPASYEKQAAFFHRGVCIEGADSFENIMDYIAWLPKAGFNSFFLQFKSPYAFLSRWYEHKDNPYIPEEEYGQEDALRDLKLFEAEMKKRDLLLHEAGHGWTGEALGYRTVSWNPIDQEEKGKYARRIAMISGKRELYNGIPANTNLCYSNKDGTDALIGLVVDYARNNPAADYLHVWLADDYNNLCECPDCSRTTLSDQYVDILNEIDRRLTEENLDTRIVFLLYQELLWPPVEKKLEHQERFVLMFAPISRTFAKSYELGDIPEKLPEFRRNHIELPTNLNENMAFLRGWQKNFRGDSFIYDYPLGRAHYGDFGYVHIARVIHSDIRMLQQMGLGGYISCQELRAALPNALPDYMMARTLVDREISADQVIEEYFRACYGESWKTVYLYLSALSELQVCDYVNGKGERIDREITERMQRVQACCAEFEPELMRHCTGASLFWELLSYHREYVLLFSDALLELSRGDTDRAEEKWEKMREYLCKNEEKYQPYFDVYRILEVTRKYTGFYKEREGKEKT